ncbi:MAG: hypothetical protein ACI83Y_001693 [Candidatus Azotimanducaceae bacterium]|jgi:hypothetical protein
MVDEVDGDRLVEVGEAEQVAPLRALGGTAKTFRSYHQHRSFLLPPSLNDWLPDGHTARFVSEVVDDMLDLTAIYASYRNAAGAPPFDPRMML